MEHKFDNLRVPRCVSYLQARDPSILNWNGIGCKDIRRNLADKFTSDSTNIVSSEKQDKGLNVHLRIKGGVPSTDLYSTEKNTLICAIPEGACVGRSTNNKAVVLRKYTFTNIFGPDSSQEDLFDAIIKEKILSFINGFNSTLLAYGASGSGKTFTMVGTAESPGIIPRALDYLFRTILRRVNKEPIIKPLPNGEKERLSPVRVAEEIESLRNILHDPQAFFEEIQHTKTYNEMQRRLSNNPVGTIDTTPPIVDVWVSFAEIYNEYIYDLLEPLPGRGQQRAKLKIGGLHDDVYIRGLKYVYVRSGLEAYQVLQYGLHNLSYAATAVNQHSSRSHCIFSIRLISGNDENHCSLSTFNFCDLAGSERLKKTLNEGDRLKESTKINTSLSVLGRCISNIRDMQQNVKDCCNAPFRESKLTHLFQKALQGKEDIFMIVNINPSLDMFDDTQHALMFSAIANQIITRAAPPKTRKRSTFFSYLQNDSLYLDEEDESKEELRELRNEKALLILQLSEFKEHVSEQVDKLIEAERTHLRTNFGEIIDIKNSQLADLRKEVDELNTANQQLKVEIRQLRRETFVRRQEVISISSDEDCGTEETSNTDNQRNYKKKIEGVKEPHESEMKRIEEENQQLVIANRDLRNKVKILEKTLVDAKFQYEKLLRVLEESTSKKIALEDQITVQNQELIGLRERAMEQHEEIERLEEIKEDVCEDVKLGDLGTINSLMQQC